MHFLWSSFFVLFRFYSKCALCADLSGRRSLGARCRARRRSARAPISTGDPGPPPSHLLSPSLSRLGRPHALIGRNPSPPGRDNACPKASPRSIGRWNVCAIFLACWWQTERRRKDDGKDADRSVVERRFVYIFLQRTRSSHSPDVRVYTSLSGESADSVWSKWDRWALTVYQLKRQWMLYRWWLFCRLKFCIMKKTVALLNIVREKL